MDGYSIPKLVTQKSAVITSELEVTIWSDTFKKLCLVLNFSFKPPKAKLLRNPTSHIYGIWTYLKTISCHSYNKIWTEIPFFNKMGHSCTSIMRLLPT